VEVIEGEGERRGGIIKFVQNRSEDLLTNVEVVLL
tara:strand:+ start:321 stop:425 length:105 start_codon:yes stop_codon:yes gene_type:complete